MPSALVAKLRKQPEVRDAEALAAWIGRYKKLRQAGVSNKKAMKLAGKQGGMKEGGVKAEDRKTGGDKKKEDVDKEVQDKIWERKNPENFNKPYLDKQTQQVLRDDPEKIDVLIEQQKKKLQRLESGRGRNLPEAAKERQKKEAQETIRALEAFRRSLKSEGGKKGFRGRDS